MARTALAVLSLALLAVVPVPAHAADGLTKRLNSDLRASGPASGAHVLDLTTGEVPVSYTHLTLPTTPYV